MTTENFIYADNAATTRMSAGAVQAMLPYFTEIYANPSSTHLLGQRAAAALLQARQRIAAILNCSHAEIFFTSGGSEADNQALLSLAALGRAQGKCHLVATAMEHHAVLRTLAYLKTQGFAITLLSPQADGIVTARQIEAALRSDTCAVSVMYANNETGALQPIAEIGRLCRAKNILLHTDAVQAVGHIPIDVQQDCIDLLSLAAHKFHGPKGVGALYARRGIQLTSLIRGGGQERGKRAGTENLPAVMGMTAALEEAQINLQTDMRCVAALRDRLRQGLGKIAGAKFNGSEKNSLPGIVNYSFAGVNGEALLSFLSLRGICASSGSACSAGSLEPSHVLLAMGLDKDTAQSALRFSLSANNTIEEVDTIIAATAEAVAFLRRQACLAQQK